MGVNPMDLGKSKSKIQLEPETGVTFEDVAGCDASKLELNEVVEFLKNPAKFSALGAKIPRGVIMEGPPGTGKTLLARRRRRGGRALRLRIRLRVCRDVCRRRRLARARSLLRGQEERAVHCLHR